MRTILLIVGIAAMMAAAQVVFGQANEGVITYESKVNLHRNLPPEREAQKAMIPEFRTTKEQLFFNAQESMYKTLIEDEEEQEFGTGGGGGMRVVMRQQNNEIYINPGSEQILSRQEFFGKEYLIADTLKLSPWKFGTETKTILGYACKQAYFTLTEEVNSMRISGSGPPTPEKRMVTREITAWYTDQIRPSLGPERFGTLPGAVLAIDINNGERVIVTTKVDLRPLKKTELKAPEKGQRVSRAEFRKITEEQMEKMRANGGGMIIRN